MLSTSLNTLTHLSFLLSPTFWSRIGFLISYIATSFLVLEVLRLIYTDANKREVEKFLESYAKQRSVSPPRKQQAMISVNIDELEKTVSVSPPRSRERKSSREGTHEARKTATGTVEEREERRRRRAASHGHSASTSQSPPHYSNAVPAQTSTSASPVRKLRKRSDTLNSSGSGEVRRRHREASPASEVGSKVSSRHGSPRRSRDERKMSVGGALGLGIRRAKV